MVCILCILVLLTAGDQVSFFSAQCQQSMLTVLKKGLGIFKVERNTFLPHWQNESDFLSTLSV